MQARETREQRLVGVVRRKGVSVDDNIEEGCLSA